VAQFHNPEEEPNCSKKIFIPIDDNQKFSIREYRNKLYSDIHKRKKEMRKKILAQHQAYYQQMGRSGGTSQGGSSHAGSSAQYSQQQQY
jgi:mitogen-activated protein kinase 15